jgi:hypothetical protein
MQLDPANFARPEGLLPGRPVTLGGVEWIIPTPEMAIGRSKASPVGCRFVYGFNGEPDIKLSQLRETMDYDADGSLKAEMEMYEHLLSLNYPALNDEQIEGLLVFKVGPDVTDPNRTEFLDVIYGRNAPKAQSDTSDLL